MKATWRGAVPQSDDTIVVEGNHYFPESDVDQQFFQPSATHTTYPWKGVASYYDVVVGTDRNRDAAWFYPDPLPAAKNITDYVAFWNGVEVLEGA